MAPVDRSKLRFKHRGRLYPMKWRRSAAIMTRNMDYEGSLVAPPQSRDEGIPQPKVIMPTWTFDEENPTFLSTKKKLMVTRANRIKLCKCCWGPMEELNPEGENIRSYVSANHSLLSFEDDKYVIKDLQSQEGTYLNGTRLLANKSYQLQDGDFIGFGVSENDTQFQQTKGKPSLVYCFQGPVENPEYCKPNPDPELKEISELDRAVFENALILSKIMSFLPLSGLKNARLVNSNWNKESSKYYYERNLQILPVVGCNRWDLLKEPYAHYFYNCKLNVKLNVKARPEWTQRVETRSHIPINLQVKLAKEERVYMNSVKYYFRNNGSFIKTLDLAIHDSDWKLFAKALPCLKNMSGFSLAMKLNRYQMQPSNLATKLPVEVLRNVKSLSLDLIPRDKSPSLANSYEEVFAKIMNIFPCVDELALGFGEYGGTVTAELVEFLGKNSTLLENVKKLAVKSTPKSYVDLRGIYLIWDSLRNMRFKQPITSLELGQLPYEIRAAAQYDDPPGIPEAVTQLIEKFAGTLQHLGLEVGIKNAQRNPRSQIVPVIYTIPRCPKLKSLQITLNSADACGGCANRNVWFDFKNPDGPGKLPLVDYPLLFPKLKSLSFKITGGPLTHLKLMGNSYIEPFVPSRGVVECETVTQLKLPKGERRSSDSYYRKWLVRVAEVFPKVESKRLSAARSRNWKLLGPPKLKKPLLCPACQSADDNDELSEVE